MIILNRNKKILLIGGLIFIFFLGSFSQAQAQDWLELPGQRLKKIIDGWMEWIESRGWVWKQRGWQPPPPPAKPEVKVAPPIFIDRASLEFRSAVWRRYWPPPRVFLSIKACQEASQKLRLRIDWGDNSSRVGFLSCGRSTSWKHSYTQKPPEVFSLSLQGDQLESLIKAQLSLEETIGHGHHHRINLPRVSLKLTPQIDPIYTYYRIRVDPRYISGWLTKIHFQPLIFGLNGRAIEKVELFLDRDWGQERLVWSGQEVTSLLAKGARVIYPKPGLSRPKITVYFSDGSLASATGLIHFQVEYRSQPPVIKEFRVLKIEDLDGKYGKYRPTVRKKVSFVYNICDPDPEVITAQINFGDGQKQDLVPFCDPAKEQLVSHIYRFYRSSEKPYRVTLIAEDSSGNAVNKTLSLDLSDVSPSVPQRPSIPPAEERPSVSSLLCPQWTPPAPGWCQDGQIVSGETDERGCPLPPKCIRPAVRSRDLDGDGIHEDFDGNGRFEITDCLSLAWERNSSKVQKNVPLYDFNSNGRLDFADALSCLRQHSF